jgi:hypothetical protein
MLSHERWNQAKRGANSMSKNENNGDAPQHITEALSDYENAVREFSVNAAEFLKQVPLLNKAREAYERATTASAQLREILDRGDETLHQFMAQMEETIIFPAAIAAPENGSSDTPAAEKINDVKVNAARA